MISNNFILILIFIIIIYFFYDSYIQEDIHNIYTSENTNNINNFDSDQKLCTTYNCYLGNNSEFIKLIGTDISNNSIFILNDKYYNELDNNLVLNNIIEKNKIKLYDIPINVPIDIKNLKLKVKLLFNNYNFIGVLGNYYYNLEYLLYEKPYELNNLNNKYYYYIFVKIIEDKYKIIYELPPREKIEQKQSIWASYGSFNIGPLLLN